MKILQALVVSTLLLMTSSSYAKNWLIGLSGLGTLYSQSQGDWNTLITDSEGAGSAQFNSKHQLAWGAQFEFIHLEFAGRFMLGLRYEQFKEKVASGTSTSTNKAHLIQFIDTFYLFPLKNGFNMFIRLGLGYIQGKGSYTILASNSTLEFKGNYFTGLATGGIEILYWHFALSIEAGYRYAVIPKNKITSASGAAFSGPGYQTGSTLMISSGGGHKFKLDYSGVFYGATVKLYF